MVNQYRLEQAASRLATTEEDILGIAMDCGWNSLSHFYALFKATYKVSLNHFRRGEMAAMLPGFSQNDARVATTDAALHWTSLPTSLLIIGGGVIGIEFACMMQDVGFRDRRCRIQAGPAT